MEEKIIDRIVIISKKLIKWAKKFKKRRYLYREIQKIDPEYFVGIKGIRGVGKTVLMLQIAGETKNSVYFSADSSILKPFSLYEIVYSLRNRGFENVFIDEIHKRGNWQEEIKTIYDEREVRIFFSGSSAIDIVYSSADLSRRVVLKELKPISLREFLNIRKGFNIPVYDIKTIIKKKKDLTIKYAECIKFFEEYLEFGGVLYPKNGFYEALDNAIRKVIVDDLSALREIDVKYENNVYKFLYFIAKSHPFETNYTKVSKFLETSKTFVIKMVEDLEKAGIIKTVFPCAKKGIDIKREPKIYLTIPIRKYFEKKGIKIEIGSLREEFFVNHFSELCYLKGKKGEKMPDFKLGDTIIEIGGVSKKRYQNPDYIAIDGLNTSENKIPLFLFGFVY